MNNQNPMCEKGNGYTCKVYHFPCYISIKKGGICMKGGTRKRGKTWSYYFDLGKIGEDQLMDYARRRGVPVELMRRFLSMSLMKR